MLQAQQQLQQRPRRSCQKSRDHMIIHYKDEYAAATGSALMCVCRKPRRNSWLQNRAAGCPFIHSRWWYWAQRIIHNTNTKIMQRFNSMLQKSARSFQPCAGFRTSSMWACVLLPWVLITVWGLIVLWRTYTGISSRWSDATLENTRSCGRLLWFGTKLRNIDGWNNMQTTASEPRINLAVCNLWWCTEY